MPHMAMPLRALIGYGGRARSYESFYSYVARLIRVNHLMEPEVRKVFPASWLRLAFEPERATTSLLEECSAQDLQATPFALQQGSIEAWLPMPALESHPPERMRYCPECLRLGLHSYAFQAQFLLRCPYHNAALTDACANCGAPIAWRHYTHAYACSALRCVRGCDIGGNFLGGVLPPPSALTSSWASQWQWVRHFRSHVSAIIGPICVTYPPCQGAWVGADQPTPGALAALFDALSPFAPDLPSRAAGHDVDHGAWVMSVQPWEALSSCWPSDVATDTVLHLFRRGAYESALPLPRSAWLDGQLERLKHGEYGVRWHYEARRGRPIDVLALPSFLLTNSEIAALYRIAMASDDIDSDADLYAQSLIDTLELAYRRRRAWDHQEATDVLDMAERLDGLVKLDGRTFRVTGCATSSLTGTPAWESFTEKSCPNGGEIYPATAMALRH